MIPKGERSIRNIPMPPHHRRAPAQRDAPSDYQEPVDEEDFEEPVLPHKKRMHMNGGWFFWIAIGVLAVCATGGILLSTFFAGATVSVTPRTAVVSVPATMLAAANAPVGTLPYQVVSTSRAASTTVTASGSSQVSKAASGIITVYNAYSTNAQPLITNTRFEAPDGKIYRIKSAIVVPGAKAAADGTLTPGTVSVTAYADQPGTEYNRGQTQFTIPGFQGDPRYSKFYAQTAAMTGGFVGMQATVAPADLTAAQNALKQGLQNALQGITSSQLPKDFLPITGTLAISYGDIAQTPGDNNTVTFSQTATASIDVIHASDLAAAIAKQKVDGYNGEAVGFADSSVITIGLAGSSTPAQGNLELALSGSPTLVWQFDPNALKAALVGKDKGGFEQIVTSFAPAITCSKDTPCSASIRPFWSGTFPSNPAKITIVTK
jgi:hypothetical protein